jgi:hypothetical protein
MSAVKKKDVFRQMYYYGLGLQEYNMYLKRHLKRQIKDIDNIFSKVGLLAKMQGLGQSVHFLVASELKPID